MDYEKVSKRIEKDKAKFVGTEIEGKTLGVVGLGAIGGRVVNAALALGMKVGVVCRGCTLILGVVGGWGRRRRWGRRRLQAKRACRTETFPTLGAT